jgi:hypothetical protein
MIRLTILKDKKMKALKYVMMVLILLITVPALAQPPMLPMGGPGGSGPMREKVRERIRTMKIWKLSEDVGLTAQQSEQFFPIYNKYQKALDDIEAKRADIIDRLDTLANNPGSSDKEINNAMAALYDIPRQMMAERDKFIKDISGILPLQQQAKLAVFEERFKQQLQEFIRDIRRGNERGAGMGNQHD